MLVDPEEKPANFIFVRPERFYLSGFINIPHVNYFFVFLCFVYIVTVLGNGLLLLVIYRTEALHTPKYMIVFNLALADLCGSTALIPKLLDIFLFNQRYITYESCLSYMFFVLLFGCVQSWTLVTMAYDRFIAICFPLRYHNIVTEKAIGVMLLITWVSSIGYLTFLIKLIDRLSFCRSFVVRTFFCDHGPLYRLACNDISFNFIVAYIGFLSFLCVPVILIALTYICISVALKRIASGEERLRAFKTCTSHLMLVAIFFVPLLSTDKSSAAKAYLHPNARIINSSLTHTITAMLNPIIYSLKTEEVLNAIKKLFFRNKISVGTRK